MKHAGRVRDLPNELTTDHREVDGLFEQIEEAAPGSPERKNLADRLTIELVRHSVAEEEHLYPAVRRHLPGGDALADKEIADHGRVEELLKDLEGREADDPEFNYLLAQLRTEVEAHVADEESNLFVQLRSACTPGDLEELGDKIRSAKKLAPTRPHPSAPDTPPGNKLLAPGAGLVDRARNFITGRGK
ncbi:hemerythrin domain-containing protein [Streptomyces sp. V1I1]|uniref:hemerythrin domain-containing protein n=1 Tax=Streptomyces sp. V1I1 TaxID=3042272 RepID=UPI002785144A|nr:hemerythrin domain-containing protein [Streptomyces sp. V1I1]MDQ0938524.1 hemerythrin superfamily protein [Streptomyces sp. V1I1]